jgi:hypothetical protein
MAEQKRCTACRATLGRLVKPHSPDTCPLLRGSYCGICACFGHSTTNCPDSQVAAFRQPQFLEQLIPSSLLEQYDLTSRTPIPGAPSHPVKEDAYMEIPHENMAVRAALEMVGGTPKICQKVNTASELTENKERLKKICDQRGVKILYLNKGLPVTATTEPKKKKAAAK